MENSPRRYSDLEKQELIEQWKQSGKTKLFFCKELDLNYFSFCNWSNGGKKKNRKSKSVFLPVQIKSNSNSCQDRKPFAELSLKNGVHITLHQSVEAAFLAVLIK